MICHMASYIIDSFLEIYNAFPAYFDLWNILPTFTNTHTEPKTKKVEVIADMCNQRFLLRQSQTDMPQQKRTKISSSTRCARRYLGFLRHGRICISLLKSMVKSSRSSPQNHAEMRHPTGYP